MKITRVQKRAGLKMFALLLAALIIGCGQQSTSDSQIPRGVRHPEWSKNLAIYEVNLRQYTEAGTFAAFAEHLPRLKKMGVGILWFMPIHPIGEEKRKGSLGSYYAVKDYFAVNPEHGTLQDFKQLVQTAHEMGLYVILDWVANHTAWDNALTVEHPEWYIKDESGNFTPPVPDWSDVIALDFSQPGLRKYMIDALKFWVRETDIDGYRCDVASMIPLDFWEEARAELDRLKPVFMLAEAEGPDLHKKAFDMTYGWEMHHLINLVAQGKRTVATLDSLLERDTRAYAPGDYRMQFTSNHDENSWKGDVFERMGDAAEVFAIFTATIPGMPLVYSGQEAGLDKRLAFFEKDVIDWRPHKFADLYMTLLELKRENRALWNGEFGGRLQRIHNSKNAAVFSFYREKDSQEILAVLNLSSESQKFKLNEGSSYPGNYTELFADRPVDVASGQEFQLDAWGYKVLVK